MTRSAYGVPKKSPGSTSKAAEDEVMDDGQEEVFSQTAVERGLVADPKALAPETLARHPKTPGRLDR